MADEYEDRVVAIINKIGDLYIVLGLEDALDADESRAPTLDAVDALLTKLVSVADALPGANLDNRWADAQRVQDAIRRAHVEPEPRPLGGSFVPPVSGDDQ